MAMGKAKSDMSISSGDNSSRGFPFTIAALLIRMVGVPSYKEDSNTQLIS